MAKISAPAAWPRMLISSGWLSPSMVKARRRAWRPLSRQGGPFAPTPGRSARLWRDGGRWGEKRWGWRGQRAYWADYAEEEGTAADQPRRGHPGDPQRGPGSGGQLPGSAVDRVARYRASGGRPILYGTAGSGSERPATGGKRRAAEAAQ